MARTSTYVHGTSPVEQERLSRLNDLLNERCVHEMDLRKGERVLDFGSGLGQLTRSMARRVGGNGCVIGVEGSEAQINAAQRIANADGEGELVQFRLGDVKSPPLESSEWGTFDVVHTRFLLEHVSDPLAVVKQMVRAARPGGRIILMDDDHDMLRLWPEAPRVMHAWNAYVRTYDRNGTDPIVGRRLVALLHAAGAKPARNMQVFFGACASDATLAPTVENLLRILDGARAPLLETNAINVDQLDEALEELGAWASRPDAALWFALPWAMGTK